MLQFLQMKQLLLIMQFLLIMLLLLIMQFLLIMLLLLMHFHLLMQLLLALLINHAEDKILNDVVAPVDLISSLFLFPSYNNGTDLFFNINLMGIFNFSDLD